jgi:hypothetical protein
VQEGDAGIGQALEVVVGQARLDQRALAQQSGERCYDGLGVIGPVGVQDVEAVAPFPQVSEQVSPQAEFAVLRGEVRS